MIDLEKNLNANTRLNQIWESYYGTEKCLAAIYQKEIASGRVTFMSLNPSLPPNLRSNAKRGNSPDLPYGRIDCSNRKESYKFYHKFFDIELPIKEWSFIDLLYIRDSNQEVLEKEFKEAKKANNQSVLDFYYRQIELTFEILQQLQPLVVVVSNKFAGILIHEFIKDRSIEAEEPSQENGYVYKILNQAFIIRESQYLGSRQHSLNKNKRNCLEGEINRVLSSLNIL